MSENRKIRLIHLIIYCILAIRSNIRLFDSIIHKEVFGGHLFASIVFDVCVLIVICQYIKSKKNNE